MRITATALLGLFALLAGTAPAPAQDKKANKPISFSKEVLPILTNYCGNCHDPKMKKGGIDVSTYAAAAKGGKGGKLWAPGNPAKSLLINEITGNKPKMPPKGTPVPKDEVEIISKWIMQGALNN